MAYMMVVWADAHEGESTWQSPAEMVDDGECLVTSVGHVLPEGEGGKRGHLTICRSINDDMVDAVLYIPLGMVRKSRWLT